MEGQHLSLMWCCCSVKGRASPLNRGFPQARMNDRFGDRYSLLDANVKKILNCLVRYHMKGGSLLSFPADVAVVLLMMSMASSFAIFAIGTGTAGMTPSCGSCCFWSWWSLWSWRKNTSLKNPNCILFFSTTALISSNYQNQWPAQVWNEKVGKKRKIREY